jgi:predicted short-subunit dehydrogenase-like oxidoreductase (DUF2520 family)
MKISLIGAGNLAWHLAQALESAGYPVAEVFSRTLWKAEVLTDKLYDAMFVNETDFSDSEASLFIMAVSDDAIAELSRRLILPEGAILVHTAGSQPIEALQTTPGIRKGVLYPLQTFTKERELDMELVPFFIEAQDEEP